MKFSYIQRDIYYYFTHEEIICYKINIWTYDNIFHATLLFSIKIKIYMEKGWYKGFFIDALTFTVLK